MSDDLRQLWKQAKAFAITRKVKPELAEEFAQEVVLEHAAKGDRGRRLDWQLIDFLRKECGATGSRAGRARSHAGRARAGQTSLDAPVHMDDGEIRLGDMIAAPVPPEESPIPAALGRAHLTRAEERVYVEIVEDEVEQVELAAVLGVTPSRVCQIFGAAKRKIRDAAALDELLDDYMRDPELSKLEVAWI